MNTTIDSNAVSAAEQQRFITKVYCYMAAALTVTGVTAMLAASSMAFMRLLFTNNILFYGLLFGELGLVIWFSLSLGNMKKASAIAAFFVYSVVNGLTLSVIFFAFTMSSIALAFFLCAATFGGMSIYGLVTKADLSRAGSYLMMALFGLIIAGVVNLLLRSDALMWITSMAAVVIFTGLTAYDTQKLKKMAASENPEIQTKQALYGALNLYLDFINLFLALLRLFGKKN